MANSIRGSVDVQLGGANRILKFDFNAICQLEKHFDKPAEKIFDEERGIGLLEIRDTLYVGLLRYQTKITPEIVGDWLQEASEAGEFQHVSEKLGEALNQALGSLNLAGNEGEDSKNSEAPKGGKKGSTSQRSSPKPAASE